MTQRFLWNPPAWPSWVNWHWRGHSDNSGWDTLHWRNRGQPPVIAPPAGVSPKEQREMYEAVWKQLKKHRLHPPGMTTQYEVAMEIANELTTIRDTQLARTR